MKNPRTTISVSTEVLDKLVSYTTEKHGTTYGTVKREAEDAIIEHIRKGRSYEK